MTTKKPSRKPNDKPAKKPTEKPTKKPMSAKATPAKVFVLFGLDEEDKPRAARFTRPNEDLIARLAQSLGLRMGITTDSAHTDLVRKLPVGNVHAAGKDAVPNVGQELYDSLNALVGGETGRISTTFPASWDEIAPGHLVIAHESAADGWWECIVVKRHEDSVTLRFRDFPDHGEFIRNVRDIALLRPDQT